MLLLLVLAISWAATLLKMHLMLRTFAKRDFPALVKDVPPVTIQNGVVSSPVSQPYTIEDPQTHRPLAILDTTGEITSLDNTSAIILVTQNKLILKENGNGQTRIQDLSKINSFFVDRSRLAGWMDLVSRWSAIAMFPIMLVGSLAYRLIQSLIYGLAGMIFSSIFNARLSFPALMRLSVLAVTPVIVLNTALDLAGLSVPAMWLLCFVMAMVYLGLAVRANAEPPATAGGFPVGTIPASPYVPPA